MVSLLILTSEIVHKFLIKKEIKENKVVPLESAHVDFEWAQVKKGTSVPKSVIEIIERLFLTTGEGQKSAENVGSENEGTKGTSQKSSTEILREYLEKNRCENGNLPSEAEIKNETSLTKKQQRRAKEKLHERGFLCFVNGRYRMGLKK